MLVPSTAITEARSASFFVAQDAAAAVEEVSPELHANTQHNLAHLCALYPSLAAVLGRAGASKSNASAASPSSPSSTGDASAVDVRPLLRACFAPGVDVLVAADKPYVEESEAVRVTLAQRASTSPEATDNVNSSEGELATASHPEDHVNETADTAHVAQALAALQWARAHPCESNERPQMAAPTCALVSQWER